MILPSSWPSEMNSSQFSVGTIKYCGFYPNVSAVFFGNPGWLLFQLLLKRTHHHSSGKSFAIKILVKISLKD